MATIELTGHEILHAIQFYLEKTQGWDTEEHYYTVLQVTETTRTFKRTKTGKIRMYKGQPVLDKERSGTNTYDIHDFENKVVFEMDCGWKYDK